MIEIPTDGTALLGSAGAGVVAWVFALETRDSLGALAGPVFADLVVSAALDFRTSLPVVPGALAVLRLVTLNVRDILVRLLAVTNLVVRIRRLALATGWNRNDRIVALH